MFSGSPLLHQKAFWWRRGLPENINRNAAARIPIAANAQPFRFHARDQPLGDHYGAILMKRTMIAEAAHKQLKAFALDQMLVGYIIDNQIGKIGLASPILPI